MRALSILFALAGALACAAACAAGSADGPVRLKDLGKFAGWRTNTLVGYGLVTGLAGTGDSPGNQVTRQMLANAMARFQLAVTPDQVQSRNAAAVMVSATLPPVADQGDTIDVVVTSAADARSLAGGSLMPTELVGPDGKVYALAQGALSVGGYKYDMNGNVVQKNHPTVGAIAAGATVEVPVRANILGPGDRLTFTLAAADYTTASRAAAAINREFATELAHARDAEGIEIALPQAMRARMVDFVTRIEGLAVQPDQRARVVVNERTGTVVSGGDVRISKVVISHGDLKISIVTDNAVSQPLLVSRSGPDVRTAVVSNSRVQVQERGETGYVGADNNTVAELIQALARIKTNTRDIISILQTLKATGALHAELVIQ